MIQVIFNGIAAASNYLLVAAGLAIVLETSRFLHFAHAVIIVIGPYAVWAAINMLGMPFLPALALGVLCAGIVGTSLEICIYRRLRLAGSSAIVLLIASMAVYIILLNAISIIFGDEAKSFRVGTISEGHAIMGARLSTAQVCVILTSIALTVIVTLLLRYTSTGVLMRAVGGNGFLARVTGIDTDAIMWRAFAVGSVFAGLAGILMAADVDMHPTMGLNPLLMGVVVVVLGGTRSFLHMWLAALLLGGAEHLGAWYLGSKWQDVIAFLVLIGALLLRPARVGNQGMPKPIQ